MNQTGTITSEPEGSMKVPVLWNTYLFSIWQNIENIETSHRLMMQVHSSSGRGRVSEKVS